MTKRFARILLAAPAAVLAATLGGTTALAATTTWTVKPGGPFTGKSGTFKLKDTRTGSTVTCASSSLSGTLKSGSGLSGTGLGSITAVGFTNCGGPLGFTFGLRAGDLPWQLNAASYNAATGVVTGSISHIHISLSGPSCSAVVDGTSGSASNGRVRFSYANGTGGLTTTGGNLHFYDVQGCAGLFNNGDPAKMTAHYTISPKQTITSP